MEGTTISTITWRAPEYSHKERGVDWLWSIGIVALAGCIIALWLHNYLFAVFIALAGVSLIFFTIRHPREIEFVIEAEGISMGRDKQIWKDIKGFTIIPGIPYAKLLILTSKKFLPLYTLPLPSGLSPEVEKSLLKVIPKTELEQSRSMQFAEKLGF
jgi:hypothetical protein